MSAPEGNSYWKLRLDLSDTGKKLTPEEVMSKSQEYIDRCLNNPLKEMDYRGKDATMVKIDKMRAMSKEGLCYYLNISRQTWENWLNDEKYLDILTRIEDLMFSYNFEGAAANQLNQSIIARKLGLTDKKETTLKGSLNIPNIPDIGSRK